MSAIIDRSYVRSLFERGEGGGWAVITKAINRPGNYVPPSTWKFRVIHFASPRISNLNGSLSNWSNNFFLFLLFKISHSLYNIITRFFKLGIIIFKINTICNSRIWKLRYENHEYMKNNWGGREKRIFGIFLLNLIKQQGLTNRKYALAYVRFLLNPL